MRATELQQLMQFLIVRPLAALCRLVARYKVFSIVWALWTYIDVLGVGATTENWMLVTVLGLLPAVAMIVNAPILWARNRDSRKERRRERLREDIARMEKELELV